MECKCQKSIFQDLHILSAIYIDAKYLYDEHPTNHIVGLLPPIIVREAISGERGVNRKGSFCVDAIIANGSGIARSFG